MHSTVGITVTWTTWSPSIIPFSGSAVVLLDHLSQQNPRPRNSPSGKESRRKHGRMVISYSILERNIPLNHGSVKHSPSCSLISPCFLPQQESHPRRLRWYVAQPKTST